MKKLLEKLSDKECKEKPKSTTIRNKLVMDFSIVDPSKWEHPKLPNGGTTDSYGTIEVVDGKIVIKPADFDIYSYVHPELNYRLFNYPNGVTYSDGDASKITKKDFGIITQAFYRSKDRRKINHFLSDWYCIWYKSKDFILCFLAIAAILCILAAPLASLVVIFFILLVCLFSYSCDVLVKHYKSL